jgi:hypothetical protein
MKMMPLDLDVSLLKIKDLLGSKSNLGTRNISATF